MLYTPVQGIILLFSYNKFCLICKDIKFAKERRDAIIKVGAFAVDE